MQGAQRKCQGTRYATVLRLMLELSNSAWLSIESGTRGASQFVNAITWRNLCVVQQDAVQRHEETANTCWCRDANMSVSV